MCVVMLGGRSFGLHTPKVTMLPVPRNLQRCQYYPRTHASRWCVTATHVLKVVCAHATCTHG
jgi:hypothetical protein